MERGDRLVLLYEDDSDLINLPPASPSGTSSNVQTNSVPKKSVHQSAQSSIKASSGGTTGGGRSKHKSIGKRRK